MAVYPVPRLNEDGKIPLPLLPDDLGTTASIDPDKPNVVLLQDGEPLEFEDVDGASNRIQVRRDTTPTTILRAGEPSFDVSTGILKIGDGVSTYSTLPSVQQALAIAPGATVARSIAQRAGDEVVLDDFYVTADSGDWGLTLTRALAYATPLGRGVHLKRLYPIKTTVNLQDNDRVFGDGSSTGLVAPTDTPLSLINASSRTNIQLSNFLVDGGMTSAYPTKSSIRGVKIYDCTKVRLNRMHVKNCADWAVAVLRCQDVQVTNHVHTGGGLGRPGGRDGLHFMDCSDILVDGADMETGDDCVALTSETVGNARVVFRNIRGSSDIGSVVINNEEGATTFPTYDLTIQNVSTKSPTRNVVRVQAINGATIVQRVNISGVSGESQTIAGMQLSRIKDLTVTGCNVRGKTHGIQMGNCENFTLSNVEATSLTANYDGFNISSSNYGILTGCRSRGAALWGIQVNGSTFVTVSECITLDCGVLSGSTGGGLRIVNGSDNTVIGGTFAGDPAVTTYGLSYSATPRLRVHDSVQLGGLNKTSFRLQGLNAVQVPAATARFKDDGTLTLQSRYSCSITKNALGDYTLNYTESDGVTAKNFGGTFTTFQATAGHNSDTARRVVQQRTAGANSIRFFVLDPLTNTLVGAEYVNVLVYDNP